jgi:basic membrane protein A
MLSLGLREDGVGLTDFRYTRDVVTPSMIATLARLQAAIVRGEIVVPKTREQLAAFRRVPLAGTR